MKFKEASEELKRCLKESKTISIPKLRKLISSMNISLKESQRPLVLKSKNGVPTVISYQGNRFILDHQDRKN